MKLKYHIGMALTVLGLILFIFAEPIVDVLDGTTGEVEYDYSSDNERMRQLQQREES